MVSTNPISKRDPDKFPTTQLFLLGKYGTSYLTEASKTNSTSHCPSCRANCSHFDLPLRVATGQEVQCWRGERCLLLCGAPYLCFRIGRVFDRNVLGWLVRQDWTETCATCRMFWHGSELDNGGVCVEHLGCAGRASYWRISEWQYWRHTDHGGGTGYKTGT
jgi:hypothetical protein